VFVCFVPCLSSCHEKATVALYFGRIRTRWGVVHTRVFSLFLWLLTTECSKPPSRDNHRKAPYPKTQQRVRWGWEWTSITWLWSHGRHKNGTLIISATLPTKNYIQNSITSEEWSGVKNIRLRSLLFQAFQPNLRQYINCIINCFLLFFFITFKNIVW